MNNKLIIADDELAFSSNLFNYLKANNNVIDIVGIALDGKQTLNLIENYRKFESRYFTIRLTDAKNKWN